MTAVPTPPPIDTTIDHARAIAACGLRVLPIKPGDKRPPMNSWPEAASTEERTIAAWWNGLYRDHGVGICMGTQPDGRHVFAVDIDCHEGRADGYETIHDLEQEHGPLPDTVTSLTGNGGQHRLFLAPVGVTVHNQQNNGNRIGPGVDVRGGGGQIVVAPTIHPDTKREYCWEHGYAPWEHKIAYAPDWLLELVKEEPAAPRPTGLTATSLASTNDSIAEQVREWWDWDHELTARGWQRGKTSGTDTYWTRPGKDPRKGHSAVLHGRTGPLVVFTSSAPESWQVAGIPNRDRSGWSFSPFGFVAAVDHNGDRSAAAKALRQATRSTTADTPSEPDDVDAYDAELIGMLVDWTAFWAKDHTEAEWLAEPLIPAGRSVALFAPGGTGKSLLALWLAAHIATGRSIFGQPIQPRHVLYLDYEMTEDDLAERLEAMGYGPDVDTSRLHYALLPALPGLDEPEGGKAVVRLAELVDAELVIVDTFGRAVHGDENEADTVRAWYRWTGIHLKHAGRAFVRVDHAGKDLTKGQRGSSAKNDDVDVVWQMTVRDEHTYHLVAKKRRMGWVPESVDLRLDDEDTLSFAMLDRPGYIAGAKELADVLDELGVPLDTSARKAARALRSAGRQARDAVVRAAVRYRFEHVELPLGRPVDNPQKSAAQNSGRAPQDEPRPDHPDAHTESKTSSLLDDLGRGAGRGGPHPDGADDGARVTRRGTRSTSAAEPTTDDHPEWEF